MLTHSNLKGLCSAKEVQIKAPKVLTDGLHSHSCGNMKDIVDVHLIFATHFFHLGLHFHLAVHALESLWICNLRDLALVADKDPIRGFASFALVASRLAARLRDVVGVTDG